MRLHTDILSRIKLELLDSRGKVVQEVVSKNFISKYAKDALKHITKFNMLRAGYSSFAHSGLTPITGNFTAKYPGICDLFSNIYLSDDATPEDPNTEIFTKGNLIGFANLQPYSGASIKRGTINFGSSIFELDRLVYVFNFPSIASNGIIRSIGFGIVNPDTESWGSHVASANGSFTSPRTATWKGFAFGADDWTVHAFEYVGTAQSRISEVDLFRHEANVREFPVLESGQYVSGLAWDGEFYYVCNNTTRRVHKYNYDLTPVTNILLAAGITPTAIGVDSTYVYVIYGLIVRRHLKGDLSFVDEFNLNVHSLVQGSFRTGGISKDGHLVVSNDTMSEILVINPSDMSLVQRLQNLTVGGTCTGGSVRNGMVFGHTSSSSSTWYVKPYKTLHTRSLLATPIEKTNFNDLRVTYEFLLN